MPQKIYKVSRSIDKALTTYNVQYMDILFSWLTFLDENSFVADLNVIFLFSEEQNLGFPSSLSHNPQNDNVVIYWRWPIDVGFPSPDPFVSPFLSYCGAAFVQTFQGSLSSSSLDYLLTFNILHLGFITVEWNESRGFHF